VERKRAKRGHWPKGKKRGPMSDEHRRGIGESVRRARVRREEFESLEAELELVMERQKQNIAELRLMVVERAERIEELEKRLHTLEEDYKARIKPTRRRLSEASAT